MSKIVRDLRNYYAVIADLASHAETWSSRPGWLEFAPNNVCNLRCIMCAQADGLPLQVMKKEDAVALLDHVLPHTTLWTPSALSEPMLANFRLVLEKCREHGVYLNMYSNCTLLDGAAFADMSERVHKLWISFDSCDPPVLEMLRAGADFAKVVQNIREVLAIAAERQIPVGFVAVLVKDNVARLAELVDFLADLGAVAAHCDLRVQPMLDNAARCAEQNVFRAHSEAQITAELDRACARARARGLNFHVDIDEPYRRTVAMQEPFTRNITGDVLSILLEEVRERFPQFCSMSTSYVKIEPDGRVFPCCRGPRELEMGNVHEQSLEQIWNGPKYREFRRRMFAQDYPEVCRTCDVLVANPHFDKAWLQRGGAAQGGSSPASGSSPVT
ncbi:MAG: SPASM domain-containing protein [Planctomycetes bacterium]|nr:SPASM domain-containing protein [Planctomycetota bacterium]